MQWEQLQQQWQQRNEAAAAPPDMRMLLQADQALQARVRSRDRRETLAAIVVVAWFAVSAVLSIIGGAWLQASVHVFIAAWGVVVPLRLRWARRHPGEPQVTASLHEHLRQGRDSAVAQARMLESAWLWYVLPVVAAISVREWAGSEPSPGDLTYLALVYAGGIVIAWLNRLAARTFRRHAESLDRMLEALEDPAGASPFPSQ